MAKAFTIALLAGAQVLLGALPIATGPLCAAELDSYQRADLVRAMKAVGPSSSEAAAVRQEQKVGEPAPAFMLGAALGAWASARIQVEFDARAPEAAGPPHNSQSGDTEDYIRQDCAEEKTAFADLQSRSKALGLAPEQVLAAAGPGDPALLSAWRARQAGPIAICR
jgi:hypothetical protein